MVDAQASPLFILKENRTTCVMKLFFSCIWQVSYVYSILIEHRERRFMWDRWINGLASGR